MQCGTVRCVHNVSTAPREGVQIDHIRKVTGAEVGILLSHSQRGMAKHPLQSKDVSTVAHVVACEGVAQYVRQLSVGQIKLEQVDHFPKDVVARPERQRSLQALLEIGGDRDRPILARLRFEVLDQAITHLSRQQSFSLAPSSSCG